MKTGPMTIVAEFSHFQPLNGARIIVSNHMTPETAVFIENLTAAGDKVVRWCSCKIFSTHDHAAIPRDIERGLDLTVLMKERLVGVDEKSKFWFCPFVMSGVTTNMTISGADILVTGIYYKGNIVVQVKKMKNDVVIYNMDPILEYNSIVLSNTGNPSFMLSCSCTIHHVVANAMLEWNKRGTDKYKTKVYVWMSEPFEENKVSALRLPAASVVETIEEEGEADDNVFDKKRILEMVVQAWSLFSMAILHVIRASKVSIDLTGPKVSIDIPLAPKVSIDIPLPPIWG